MATDAVAQALPDHFSPMERERASQFLVTLWTNVAVASRGNDAVVARVTQAVQHLATLGPLQAALVEGSSPIVRGRGSVPMFAAAKGLCKFGMVRLAASLWRHVVPVCLMGR